METKPAIRTTEFWVHALVQLFFLLNTLNVYTYVPDPWSGLAQAVLAAAYIWSRGQAKSGVPYGGATAVVTSTDPAASASVNVE